MTRRQCDNCGRVRSCIVPLARSWVNRGKRICWECHNATVQERKRRHEEGLELTAAEARRQKTKKHQTLTRQIWEGKPHGPIPDVDGQMTFSDMEPEVSAVASRIDAPPQP